MSSYPQTIPTGHLRMRATIALFALVGIFLLVAGAAFALGSLQGDVNGAPRRSVPCTHSQPRPWQT